MSNPARSSNYKKNSKGKKKLRTAKEQKEVVQSFWGELNPDHVTALIDAVTRNSGALIFNRSRDGGVLGIKLLHEDYEADTIWGHSRGEIQETLEEIWEAFKHDA